MSIQRTTLTNAKNYDATVFEGTSRPELLECLRAWFNGWEEERPNAVDDEVLSDAGILLGKSGYENLDKETLDWYLERSSSIRHEIMADFLIGYWRTAKQAHADVIQRLLLSLNELPHESWAYAASLLALYKAVSSRIVRPSSLLQDVRNALLNHLNHLQEAGLHKGVAQFLEYLRE